MVSYAGETLTITYLGTRAKAESDLIRKNCTKKIMKNLTIERSGQLLLQLNFDHDQNVTYVCTVFPVKLVKRYHPFSLFFGILVKEVDGSILSPL